MGSSKSRPLEVLVIGLSNAGKTHFLDMFHFGPDCTKRPTNGLHQVSVDGINLTEFGGSIHWAAIYRASKKRYDALYLIVNGQGTQEHVMESNNALLMMMEEMPPHIPVAVIWHGGAAGHLKHLPRPVGVCELGNYEIDWRERVSELFEWTVAQHQQANALNPPG